MKTVKDYKDLGLLFIEGDVVHSETGDINSKGASLFKCSVNSNQIYHDVLDLELSSGTFCCGEWTIKEFAWRENIGIAPSYRGDIEVGFYSGHIIKVKGFSFESLYWERGQVNCIRDFYIKRWRPVIIQEEKNLCDDVEPIVTDRNLVPIKEESKSVEIVDKTKEYTGLSPSEKIFLFVGKHGLLKDGECMTQCVIRNLAENNSIDMRSDREKTVDKALSTYTDVYTIKDFLYRLESLGMLVIPEGEL